MSSVPHIPYKSFRGASTWQNLIPVRILAAKESQKSMPSTDRKMEEWKLSELTQYLQVFYVANAFCKPVIYQKF
jgi:hypothetical protein